MNGERRYFDNEEKTDALDETPIEHHDVDGRAVDVGLGRMPRAGICPDWVYEFDPDGARVIS